MKMTPYEVQEIVYAMREFGHGHIASRPPFYEVDLSGMDLSHMDFADANLSGADLRGADLSYSSLYGATLSGTDLIGANLSKAWLRDVNLNYAKYTPSTLAGAHFAFPIGMSDSDNDVIKTYGRDEWHIGCWRGNTADTVKRLKANKSGRALRSYLARMLSMLADDELAIDDHHAEGLLQDALLHSFI